MTASFQTSVTHQSAAPDSSPTPDSRQLPLRIRGIEKRFGDVVAVDGVDLELGADELLTLVGPSGCGKSTVLRSIAGLEHVDVGTIELAGHTVDDGHVRLPPERRSVGLVFQEHALFPHLTVRDNVGFGVRDVPKPQIAGRVDEMLELVNLGQYADRYPHELSGGERQRVALARALAPRPALMLFDEPFASLDHNLRVKLRHDVVAALRATATPAVFVTHFQEEALTIGDRIAIMHAGRIAQVGTPSEVFHEPTTDFVGRFMGAASFLPLRADGAEVRTTLGAIDATGSLPDGAMAMVRPDDVLFDTDPDGDATVESAEYHGSSWLVSVRHDDGADVLIAASHLDAPMVGERGRLRMNPGHRQTIVAHDAAVDHTPR